MDKHGNRSFEIMDGKKYKLASWRQYSSSWSTYVLPRELHTTQAQEHRRGIKKMRVLACAGLQGVQVLGWVLVGICLRLPIAMHGTRAPNPLLALGRISTSSHQMANAKPSTQRMICKRTGKLWKLIMNNGQGKICVDSTSKSSPAGWNIHFHFQHWCWDQLRVSMEGAWK